MARTELNPDQIAALLDQKAHLLRSLDDLDAEYGAGDMAEDDYRTLRDDYTARAAWVLRSLESHQAQVAAVRPARSRPRTVAWVVGLAVFAVVAGFVVKQAAGTRGVNDAGSGEIRQNVRQVLFEAQQAGGVGQYDRAIELYSEVLVEQPSNVEAYTYRGWMQFQQGETDALDLARADLDTAIELDASATAPRVFRAVVASRDGRPADAAADLLEFSRAGGTADEVALVGQSRLRERVADDLSGAGEPVAALEFLRAIWAIDEADADIAAHLGLLLSRVPTDETLAAAEDWTDKALAIDPAHPAALVYRALIKLQDESRLAEAQADIAAYNEGGVYPEYVQAELAAVGLLADN